MFYRKLLVTLMLALASTGAMAEWTKLRVYGEKDDYGRHTQYVDLTTMRRAGNTVRLLDLSDYDFVQLTMPFGGQIFLSVIKVYEIDCTSKKYSVLNASWFSENMGSGNVVSKYTGDDWSPINSKEYIYEETLWELVCHKKQP